jgi:hypothetical protein
MGYPEQFERNSGIFPDMVSGKEEQPAMVRTRKADQPLRRTRLPGDSSSGFPNRDGRPLSLSLDQVRQAYLATSRLGAGRQQLAELFDVDPDTISLWMRNGRRDIAQGDPDTIYALFLIAVKSGEDEFNSSRTEEALLKRALGFEYEEVSVRDYFLTGKDQDGVEVQVPTRSVTRTTKQVLPDTTAIMFWLQNRAPHRWKNVKRVEAEVKGRVQHEHLHAAIPQAGPVLPISQLTSQRRKLDLSRLSDRELAVFEKALTAQALLEKELVHAGTD